MQLLSSQHTEFSSLPDKTELFLATQRTVPCATGEEDALHVTLGICSVVILCKAVAAVGGVEEGEGLAQIVIDKLHDNGAAPVGEALPDHSAVEI